MVRSSVSKIGKLKLPLVIVDNAVKTVLQIENLGKDGKPRAATLLADEY